MSEMTDRERDYAVMEAELNAAQDAYFKARPQLMRTRHEECLFEAGFKAAWNARPAPAQDTVRVPREPSDELIQRMAVAYENSPCHDLIGPMEDAYRAMLAAAPAVSQSLTTAAPCAPSDGCQCPACAGGTLHSSDCAVHNAPAMPKAGCDCGAAPCADEAVAEPVGHVRRAPGSAPGCSYVSVHGAGLLDLPDGAPLYTDPPVAAKPFAYHISCGPEEGPESLIFADTIGQFDTRRIVAEPLYKAPPAAPKGDEARDAEIVTIDRAVITSHIADLRRCSAIFGEHEVFASTADEFNKAADELDAAIAAGRRDA